MKKLIFISILSTAFILGGISVASAHCGSCGGGHAKTEKNKPCTKCMDCKCGDKAKKPCEKKMKKEKPCKTCEQNDKRFEMDKNMTKGTYHKTEKGDYHVMSRGQRQSSYND